MTAPIAAPQNAPQTAPMPKRTLIGSLIDLLPAATINSVTNSEWRSATFSGIRSCIKMTLPGENAAGRADIFRANLPAHEFNLWRYFCADILVTDITETDGGVILTVEALLLDA